MLRYLSIIWSALFSPYTCPAAGKPCPHPEVCGFAYCSKDLR